MIDCRLGGADARNPVRNLRSMTPLPHITRHARLNYWIEAAKYLFNASDELSALTRLVATEHSTPRMPSPALRDPIRPVRLRGLTPATIVSTFVCTKGVHHGSDSTDGS